MSPRAKACVVALAMASVSAPALSANAARWSPPDLLQLEQAIVDAGREGLRSEDYDLAEPSFPNMDSVADAAAKSLAHDLNEGRNGSADQASWHIPREAVDYDQWLDEALARHDLRDSFRALRPTDPAYERLVTAWLQCAQPAQCDTLATNLDRWRRLPRNLGDRFLWVNTAAFRVDLVEHGSTVASRRVIVGKPGSQTPVFKAFVTGVTANPWWNVPCEIVDKELGRMVRDKPVEASRRGYVTSKGNGGRTMIRQRPGPWNALGQIKLEMPNPYAVYLHDTPNRELFAQSQRTFSHGCVRMEGPVSLGKRLLEPVEAAALDVALTTGASKTFRLARPIPIYVVYMTAEPDDGSGIAYHEDVYRRDVAPATQSLATSTNR